MRVLLVSHPPLAPENGAAQTALELAAALRARGHDALAWSPAPLPPDTRWWQVWRRQRQALERFAAGHGPFDVIDTPAISASRRLARSGSLVVRSIQPELRYLWRAIRDDLLHAPSPRALAHAIDGLPRAAVILGGWQQARVILSLGSLEAAWMRQRFPRWRRKLGVYFNALPEAERPALAEVRRRRAGQAPGEGVRYLWLGRWSGQKGAGRLVRFLRARLAAGGADGCTLAGCGWAPERDLDPEWLRSGRVRIVPSFSRAELPALLAAHDAGLFTSPVEGWGLGLMEMLEAGLAVYATEAGAVPDLRPYFPRALRPFPPSPDVKAPDPGGLAAEDLEANGYYARFAWPTVAGEYERQALVPVAGR